MKVDPVISKVMRAGRQFDRAVMKAYGVSSQRSLAAGVIVSASISIASILVAVACLAQ